MLKKAKDVHSGQVVNIPEYGWKAVKSVLTDNNWDLELRTWIEVYDKNPGVTYCLLPDTELEVR